MIREVLNMNDSTLTIETVLEEAGLAAKYELKGEARGEARGEEKARTEIARNLLGMGWTVEQTALTSRLSIEKVQTLYEDIHNS
jgi:predicted transposase YdaD